MAAYNEDRDWEVNGARYKKDTSKETTEADFKDLNRFLVGRGSELAKQAADREGYGQEAAGAAALGGGGLLAAANRDKAIGMETRYHGTGSEAAKSIQQNGLLGSRAGSGVSTRRAKLEESLGEDAIKGKVYLGKGKRISNDFALQAGLENAGIKSGSAAELVDDSSTGVREKLNILRNARKDATLLQARIPFNELNDGTHKVVPNPELRGLQKEDFVSTIKKETLDANPGAALFMTPEQEKMIDQTLRKSYEHLGEGTEVIEGDLASRYFKGGDGYRGQNLRGVMEYAASNPGRFAKGVGATGAGLGIAGAGAYGIYDGMRDKMNNENYKEANTVNMFLDKKANYEEPSVGNDLAYLGGAAAGGGAFLGGVAAKEVTEGTGVQRGLHPDVREIMQADADAIRKARLEKILSNKGNFAFNTIATRPAAAVASTIGAGIMSTLGYQALKERQASQHAPAGEAKTAFAEMREGLEKSAAFLR